MTSSTVWEVIAALCVKPVVLTLRVLSAAVVDSMTKVLVVYQISHWQLRTHVCTYVRMYICTVFVVRVIDWLVSTCVV